MLFCVTHASYEIPSDSENHRRNDKIAWSIRLSLHFASSLHVPPRLSPSHLFLLLSHPRADRLTGGDYWNTHQWSSKRLPCPENCTEHVTLNTDMFIFNKNWTLNDINVLLCVAATVFPLCMSAFKSTITFSLLHPLIVLINMHFHLPIIHAFFSCTHARIILPSSRWCQWHTAQRPRPTLHHPLLMSCFHNVFDPSCGSFFS